MWEGLEGTHYYLGT